MKKVLMSFAIFGIGFWMATSVSGQTEATATPPGVPFGENPISNDQFAVLLSIDYAVSPLSNGWLRIESSTSSFFAQSSPAVPELNFRMAWPNAVQLTAQDVNVLNANLSHGGLHLDTKTNELVLEFSDPHLTDRPTAKGLLASVQMFELMIDAVVEMVAQI